MSDDDTDWKARALQAEADANLMALCMAFSEGRLLWAGVKGEE